MATEDQISANKENAQKGGVKTDAGKAIVSMNPLKHGLCASRLLLPGEDEEALTELSKRISEHHSPVGAEEEWLCDRIVALLWRLSRVVRAETAILRRRCFDRLISDQRSKAGRYVRQIDPLADMHTFGAVQSQIVDDRRYRAEILKAEELEEEAGREGMGLLAGAFSDEHETLVNISRYETGIERSLFRILERLELIQAARKAREASRK